VAAPLVHQNEGEIFALHVVRVPQPLGLSDGRAFLKYGRPLLDEVVEIGQEYEVPVRTQLRLGRQVEHSIMTAARDRNTDLILLGWPGHTDSIGTAFGSIIDVISANPPCDLAVVRMLRSGLPCCILVPINNDSNSQLALEIALLQADFVASEGEGESSIVALHLVPEGTKEKDIEERRQALYDDMALEGLPIDLQIIPSSDPVQDILEYSEEFDEIVIGASEERLLEQQLFGSVPQRVAEEALKNVIMVKRFNPIKHGLLGQWVGRRSSRIRQEE
jgi:CIC family chloride channel protein